MIKMQSSKILKIIYEAIDELNEQLPSDQKLEKSEATVLFDNEGKLDSLGLVNLIVLLEQKIDQNLNVQITLADEKAMSQEQSPFKSIKTLIAYISKLLEEKSR